MANASALLRSSRGSAQFAFRLVEQGQHVAGGNALIHGITAEENQRLAEPLDDGFAPPAVPPGTSEGDEEYLFLEFDATAAQALDKAEEYPFTG